MTHQLSLFEPLLIDEIEHCTECGRAIVTQHFTLGCVSSEFIDEQGRCFKCNKTARAAMTRPTLFPDEGTI